MSTGGRQPRFFIWENVPGAFTSGSERGADFRAVLESIAETSIPMPKDGRWANAGMVQCQKCEIAWRVLDAQYWGVPQRRRRIFLVADFAAADRRAAEVLFVEPCVPRDSAESERAREEIAGNARESVDSAGETLTPWDVQSNRIQSVNGKAAALYGGAGQGTHNGAIFDTRQIVMSVHENQQGEVWETNKFAALSTGGGKPGQGYPCVACYDISHRQDVIRPQEKGTLPCLTARAGTGGNNLPVVHSYCIAGNTIDRQPQNGGNGNGNQAELAYTLNTVDRHAVATQTLASGGNAVGCLMANCGTKQWLGNQEAFSGDYHIVTSKTVRRLTPTECERLQGWPDGYTDVPLNGKPASDANRYKALGNGMAQPCADFVLSQIVAYALQDENEQE